MKRIILDAILIFLNIPTRQIDFVLKNFMRENPLINEVQSNGIGTSRNMYEVPTYREFLKH